MFVWPPDCYFKKDLKNCEPETVNGKYTQTKTKQLGLYIENNNKVL